jgi:hypothetical protein
MYRIIGLCGAAGVGKSYIANMLGKNENFVERSFAKTLKEAAAVIFDFSHEQLYGPSEKRNEPDPRWAREGREPLSPREALQVLGTEIARQLHDDVWIRAGMRAMDPNTRYVFPDVRFNNEARAIRDMGGVVVKVCREGTKSVRAHASEQGIDPALIDFELDNVLGDNGFTMTALQSLVSMSFTPYVFPKRLWVAPGFLKRPGGDDFKAYMRPVPLLWMRVGEAALNAGWQWRAGTLDLDGNRMIRDRAPFEAFNVFTEARRSSPSIDVMTVPDFRDDATFGCLQIQAHDKQTSCGALLEVLRQAENNRRLYL